MNAALAQWHKERAEYWRDRAILDHENGLHGAGKAAERFAAIHDDEAERLTIRKGRVIRAKSDTDSDGPEYDDGYGSVLPCIIALCDDGTMWQKHRAGVGSPIDAELERLIDIPQNEESSHES